MALNLKEFSHLNASWDLSFDAIFITDSKGQICYANRTSCEVLQRSDSALVGADIREFVDRESEDQLESAFHQLREQGHFLSEFPLKTENEDPILFEWGVKADAHSGLVVWTGRNIKGRKSCHQDLRAQLKQKETLIKEVHHRVKNQFQILSSLLHMQASSMPDLQEMIRTTQNRIQTMALIHENLYHVEDSVDVDLSHYLAHLADNLYSSYGYRKGRIQMLCECEPIAVELNTAVTVGLITNEILSNSFKYAFPNGNAGEISLRSRRENSHLVLQLGDNGIGLPDHTQPGTSKTLGLKLVALLINQLSGSLHLDRAGGTKYTISIPNSMVVLGMK